jgi:AcrR family transcriptional regulator
MPLQGLHPTKRVLLETVIKLLDDKEPNEILSDEVLQLSGISKGSMYYHYKDWYEIVEDAICERFAWYVDRSVELCEAALRGAKSRDDLMNLLKGVTRDTQKPEQAATRYARVRAIAMASQSERMRQKLGVVQERLTEALEDLFREAQERGWASKEIDPRAAAVMVQAYTFGHIVDDFTPSHMKEEAWYAVVDGLVEKVFFPPK